MSGNKVILNIKPKNKINMEVLPPSLSLTDVERAENAANVAMAWAQDAESPDGENDTDSPTGKTQSSKSWALNAKNDASSAAASASAAATSETNAITAAAQAEVAKQQTEQIAGNLGNPVTDVDEDNGTVTVTKSDGTQKTFKAGINILQRSKAYSVGDIAYSFSLPSWAYLECTEAGTTAAAEPSFAAATKQGTYVTDGTAEFILCDMRDGTPVGRVVYAETLLDGYVKYNGATVLRNDYKRPTKFATDKNLFYDIDDTYTFMGTTSSGSTTITGISAANIEKLQTAKQVCGDGILITGTGIAADCMIDEISTDSVTITAAATAAGTVKISYGNIHNYPYMYGKGDGSTTIVLPNYRGRFIMGGDNVLVQEDALPNIIGQCGSADAWSAASGATDSAIWKTSISGDWVGGNVWQDHTNQLYFNASRSNEIYGKSDKVLPKSFALLPQIKY